MNIKKIKEYLDEQREEEGFVKKDVLEPVSYENRERNTWVEIDNPEFTSLCPKTGLPDFGSISIKYLPDQYIVELKSLKYYFLQYRNTGIFYENLTKMILDHLVSVLEPFEMIVEAHFSSRGGIKSKVISKYKK